MKAVVFDHYGGNDVVGTGRCPSRYAVLTTFDPGSGGRRQPVDWKVRSGELRFLTGKRFPKVLGMRMLPARS